MIDLPIDVKLIYDADLVLYKKQTEQLKKKAVSAKSILLSEQFKPYSRESSIDDKVTFVLQFIECVLDLALFPDAEVFDKLKELKFGNESLKWFVKLNDVLTEIERLNNINGVFLLPNALLFAINSHLTVKLLISIVEYFGLDTNYNNSETNILYKDFSERYRRIDYNNLKGQTPKMNWFERAMFNLLQRIENNANVEEEIVRKMMLQSAKGNTSMYLSILDLFHTKGISKNKFYIEMFPLLKMIAKDFEFLAEEDYYTMKDDKYDAKYSSYKLARVKKFLQKK